MATPSPGFERACTWLGFVCLGFASLGAFLPLAYGTPLFAMYRDAVGAAIGDAAAATSGRPLTLALALTGGAITGKWLLHFAVVRYGVALRLRWARDATLAGLLAWFTVDSVSSLVAGAWANVVFINGMPLLLVLPLLRRVWRECDVEVSPTNGARLASMVLVVPILAACGFAFGLFGSAGATGSGARLLRFFAGPTGGATVGHLVLIAMVARFTIGGRARWGIIASGLSLVAAVIVDGIYLQ